MSDPVHQATELTGKTAGMIADYGMLVMVGALALIVAGGTFYLIFLYWRRRVGAEYIERSKALEYVRKEFPHLFKKTADDLPKLIDHPLFAACTNEIRGAESLFIRSPDGAVKDLDTMLARDLLVWTLRGIRDVTAGVVQAAYEHKEGFEPALGDSQRFVALVMENYSLVEGAVRQRLVEEYNYPVAVYDTWRERRRDTDRLMHDMVELAATQNDQNYWRLNAVLNSLFARVTILRDTVCSYINHVDLTGIKYDRNEAASESTYSEIKKTNGTYKAAALERGWRPRIG